MRAAFLDLNGTLVMPVKAQHPSNYVLLPRAIEAIQLLNTYGYVCPIITVQSRISKQIYTQSDFLSWFETLKEHLSEKNAFVVGPYICPHQKRDMCACMKPLPCLYKKAAPDYDIDVA